MPESPKTESADVELSVDVSGKASVKLTAVQTLVKYLAPGRFAKAQAIHAVTDNLHRKLKEDSDLGRLSTLEQHMVLSAFEDSFKRTSNRAAIAEKACEYDPTIRPLFEASPQKLLTASTVGEEINDPPTNRQAFWDRFWADAEVLTDEYMQELFARVLAGEVKKPRSFSLKTLEVLRCLEEDIATLYVDLARLAFLVDSEGCIPILPEVSFGQLLKLADVGLVSPTPASWTLKPESREVAFDFRYAGRWIRPKGPVYFEVRPLTIAGFELLQLLPQPEPAVHVFAWLSKKVPFEISEHREGPFTEWAISVDEDSITHVART